jgi:formate/nitrite transporter
MSAAPQNNAPVISFDALMPGDMAAKAEAVGVKKATGNAMQLFALAILAGAFIALGAIFCTTVLTGSSALTLKDATGAVTGGGAATVPYGITRFLGGLVFCVGLILVVVGGAELFTGNALIVMAWADRQVTTLELLRNWGIVYVGNFVGSVLTALLMFFTRQYTFAGGAIGLTALTIANTKCGLDFIQAVALGIMCNALVCLAVWLCFSARSTTDKILSILFPISCFVACGFEHSIANMYFIPIGLYIKAWGDAAFWTGIGKTAADFAHLTWGHFFLKNLLPVTLGNVIGGGVMIGLIYWFVYLRKSKP